MKKVLDSFGVPLSSDCYWRTSFGSRAATSRWTSLASAGDSTSFRDGCSGSPGYRNLHAYSVSGTGRLTIPLESFVELDAGHRRSLQSAASPFGVLRTAIAFKGRLCANQRGYAIRLRLFALLASRFSEGRRGANLCLGDTLKCQCRYHDLFRSSIAGATAILPNSYLSRRAS